MRITESTINDDNYCTTSASLIISCKLSLEIFYFFCAFQDIFMVYEQFWNTIITEVS